MAATLAEATTTIENTTIENAAREPEIADLGGMLSVMGPTSSARLAAAGARVDVSDAGFRVRVDRRLDSFDVVTLPCPGFPTDLQPFAMALAAVSDGTAMITETSFEARFMFAQSSPASAPTSGPTVVTPSCVGSSCCRAYDGHRRVAELPRRGHRTGTVARSGRNLTV